jgi:hypothetical protein
MEYLPGETLEQRISHTKLSVVDIADIIAALGEALDYAHHRDVVHRDLKPSNIMFTESGEPVIVDFGLAKLLEITVSENRYTGESTVSGTPAYMAPEQLMGERATAASDRYSLALIAYWLLTGHQPHNSADLSTLVMDRVSNPPKPATDYVAELPPAINDVFNKALARTPEDRYTTATEFARAFGDALLPDREATKVVTVIDPIQAALLEATRGMLRNFYLVLAGVVAIVMLYCISLFLRGYQVGSPSVFVWDGIYADAPLADGGRSVSGLWSGSVAERAGIQQGDLIYGDLRTDKQKITGDFSVNGVPRAVLPLDWQPKYGDQITRLVKRDNQQFQVSYTLEPVTFYPFQLMVYIIPAAIGFICALLLLRRWGAEPGLQIFFPLEIGASFYMISRSVGGPIIPYIDGVVAHIVLAALIHFMLVFPTQASFLKKHPNLVWLLYIPLINALIEFMTGQSFPPGARINFSVIDYPLYSLGILLVLIFKWLRKDVRQYKSLWWFISGFSLIILATVLDSTLYNRTYPLAMNVFKSANVVNVVSSLQLGISIAIVMLIVSYGYHRVQLTMGETLSYEQVSNSRRRDDSGQDLPPVDRLLFGSGNTTPGRPSSG